MEALPFPLRHLDQPSMAGKISTDMFDINATLNAPACDDLEVMEKCAKFRDISLPSRSSPELTLHNLLCESDKSTQIFEWSQRERERERGGGGEGGVGDRER